MAQKKTVSKNKSTSKSNSNDTSDYNREFLILGHLVKYNIYLLTKAVVFSTLCQKMDDINAATEMTNKVLSDLDLDAKKRSETSSDMQQEELQ